MARAACWPKETSLPCVKCGVEMIGIKSYDLRELCDDCDDSDPEDDDDEGEG